MMINVNSFKSRIYCIFPSYRILLVKRFIVVKYCN